MAKANPFRFSTKYQDDEADLLYYGYRYYSASTGRWLSWDLLAEAAFFDNYTASKTWEEQRHYWWASLAPAYTFVRNSSVATVDPFGLDRWHVDELHTAVVVEEWNKCCTKVIGYKRIEYGPRNAWALIPPFFTGPGKVTIMDSGKPSGFNVSHLPSICRADQILLAWAKDMAKDPPIYNFWVFNCRHFSAYAQNVGIGD